MATPEAETRVFKFGMKDPPSASTDFSASGAINSIRALQDELERVGVVGQGESFTRGTFDGATRTALKRFEWYVSFIPGVLRGGVFEARAPTPVKPDGIADSTVLGYLEEFRRNLWIATGDLVKIDFLGLNRVHPNFGFKALVGGDTNVGVCDREFGEVMRGMSREAGRLELHVFVNQLFRVEGASVSGAVVPPASFSAHKLGRAVDLQLGTSGRIESGNPKLSAAIKKAPSNTPFGKFREHAKDELGCRYGGNFVPSDPPHFDLQIMPSGSDAWKNRYFFNQLQYNQAQANADAIPYLIKFG